MSVLFYILGWRENIQVVIFITFSIIGTGQTLNAFVIFFYSLSSFERVFNKSFLYSCLNFTVMSLELEDVLYLKNFIIASSISDVECCGWFKNHS